MPNPMPMTPDQIAEARAQVEQATHDWNHKPASTCTMRIPDLCTHLTHALDTIAELRAENEKPKANEREAVEFFKSHTEQERPDER